MLKENISLNFCGFLMSFVASRMIVIKEIIRLCVISV